MKAFDSISRGVLWSLPVKIVTIIRAFYKGFSVQVIHSGQKTEPLNITRTSVRQDCLLYLLQFLVTLGWVTRTAFARRHAILTVILHSDLDFADDLALLLHRVQDMRDKTQALKEQGEKVGLKINAAKTKMICIYTKCSDGVFIKGEQVKEVDKFTTSEAL